MVEIYFNNEKCYPTQFVGYYVTKSGKVITIKKKGGQGSLDYNSPREHCYKIDKNGYLECCLSSEGVHKYVRVHRLVYETMRGPIPNDLTIDHIDKNVQNNNIDNLRLLTREENSSIAHKNNKSLKRYLYKVDNVILDRQQIEEQFHISRRFWYNTKNKIDNKNYKINDIILYRV